MEHVTDDGLILDGIFYSVPALNILQGAYLRVAPGSVCGLFGRNGSGKSTLLKVAAGQIEANSGIVIVDGKRLYKRSLRERFSHIAYLPQDSMLPGDMKVKHLINALPGAQPLFDDALIKAKIKDQVRALSFGQRRYLEVSLLLSLGRPYLLLDEPFTGIEPLMIDYISSLLVNAAQSGVGILVTDHYHQYLLDLAGDAYVMVNKQCKHLDGSEALRGQLQQMGYMPKG